MSSMKIEEYMTKFLDLLRYVTYLKDGKMKVQMFISGFPLTFKDQNEYNEPQSLEEVSRMLNHCYEQPNHNYEPKRDWKGNGNSKGKCAKNRGIPQNVGYKEKKIAYKKFNAVDRLHGYQLEV